MVFATGFAGGSHTLYDLLDGYITSTTGWSTHATIATRDKVYTSAGVSGSERLFIRMTAGETDPHREGRTLKNSPTLGSGFSSSITFRAYQYFDATNLDGYNEIGIFGPKIFFYRGGNSTQVYAGDWQASPNAGQIFWDQQVSHGLSFDDDHNTTDSGHHSFDGTRFIYSTSDNELAKYDIFEQTTTTLATAPASRVMGTTYYRDPVDNGEYLFAITNSTTNGIRTIRYDVANNSWGFMANHPWGANEGDGSAGCWDGYDKLYFSRGDTDTDFATYTISTDSWSGNTPLLNGTARIGQSFVFVPANAENGLGSNRLYHVRGTAGSSTYSSLDIDANGDPSGSWTARASLPFTAGEGGKQVYLGGDYIWYGHGGSQPSAASERVLSRYQISTNTWTQLNAQGLPNNLDGGGNLEPVFHKQFLPVDDEGSTTEFWFFGNADRIMVVVKDENDVYDFSFAGLVTSYYSRLFATTTGPISAGNSMTVTVDDGSIFAEGQVVHVANLTAGTGDFIIETGFDQKTRLFYPHETTRVTAVVGNDVTLGGLVYNYPTGTRLGIDLQPVAVTGFRNNGIHMMNHVSNGVDNAAGGLIPQMYNYNCPVSGEATSQSAEEDRTGQYMLWPLVIGSNWEHAGKEIRGQLNGVFIVDDDGSAVVGDLVSFLGENYMLFQFDSEFYNDDRLFAFGPV